MNPIPAKPRIIIAQVERGGRGSDTEPKCRVDPNNGCASDDERKSLIIRRLTRGRSPVR
jgi:hypothetical protein